MHQQGAATAAQLLLLALVVIADSGKPLPCGCLNRHPAVRLCLVCAPNCNRQAAAVGPTSKAAGAPTAKNAAMM